jgi:hypothetical protein
MKAFYFFVLCCLLNACSAEPKPKNILPTKKMQGVMWDMLRADEVADYYGGIDTNMRKWTVRAGYYKEIFQLHSITEQDFRKSLLYYQNHPSELQIILDSLQAQGDRVQKIESNKPTYPLSKPQIKNGAGAIQ